MRDEQIGPPPADVAEALAVAVKAWRVAELALTAWSATLPDGVTKRAAIRIARHGAMAVERAEPLVVAATQDRPR